MVDVVVGSVDVQQVTLDHHSFGAGRDLVRDALDLAQFGADAEVRLGPAQDLLHAPHVEVDLGLVRDLLVQHAAQEAAQDQRSPGFAVLVQHTSGADQQRRVVGEHQTRVLEDLVQPGGRVQQIVTLAEAVLGEEREFERLPEPVLEMPDDDGMEAEAVLLGHVDQEQDVQALFAEPFRGHDLSREERGFAGQMRRAEREFRSRAPTVVEQRGDER